MVDKLKKYDILFWDFDGVIKDSVEVKGNAFKTLFSQFGTEVVKKVEKHHLENGGISRYNKIPIYLTWAGLDPNNANINKYALEFSKIVINSVIESSWVEGVKEFILENYIIQEFYLLTATPQQEIEFILNKLGIFKCFNKIYGSPINKLEIINLVLNNNIAKKAAMIGDSNSDFKAALSNNIDFFLRCTPLNLDLQKLKNIHQFESLR